MRAVAAARTPHGECDIDLCEGCHALWFDTFESVQLTPLATLALFREVASAPAPARRALPASMRCPRCRATLATTRDLRHTTRFCYWRCPKGHGRFTPFIQFLREKDFIRPLDPVELARLKAHVQSIGCSGCGGSVDLARDMVCRYCGAPVEALDPDAIANAVASLQNASAKRPGAEATTREPARPLPGALESLDAGAWQWSALPQTGGDLIATGLAWLGDVLDSGTSPP